ncbi:hypothetical protein [Pseudaestuariivita rosea]|uniref:hypothetical protein n=1 Tax=Pseudaestuariivita rosea TaxID=2763263 RepID=UPI001ABA09E2|nr:hypothetical protein [Pseudaestuariivita rosea]
MKKLAILALLALAACGVDGEPIRPSFDAGVSTNDDTVRGGAAVGVDSGPVSVRVGTGGAGIGIRL